MKLDFSCEISIFKIVAITFLKMNRHSLGNGGGHLLVTSIVVIGLPGGSDGKESACKAGDPGSIPGWERSPGEGNGYPRQYSCLENSMDKESWWAAVHGAAKSWTRLSH